MLPTLPITEVLPELEAALINRHEAVLQAEPGAGKTTLVPLALLQQPWLGTQKILMLEPRRLAARGAAERMAQLLGEPVGQTVGYRMRLETRVSAQTRIEVITEGILNRMLQSDPSLEGIGLVIFDEFHERNLDADLGLALVLQGRRWFRSEADGALPLKVLLMSATLDSDNMSQILAHKGCAAPMIQSAGRQFPVIVHYVEDASQRNRVPSPLVPKVTRSVLRALQEQQGSVLVFLPGQAEIRAVQEGLADSLGQRGDILLAPLFGDLSLEQQRQAIAAAPAGLRKVVLATNIAESSLTIEGVSVVVDAGLERAPVFDPQSGMTRLATRRISRASAIQRSGRAGRLSPGVCYRLWPESQQAALTAFTPAEILQADLAPLALQLIAWGVSHPSELEWLDAPPLAAWQQALELLQALGAIKPGTQENGNTVWSLSDAGKAMASLPTHPRLAHLLLRGLQHDCCEMACDIAALLSERDPLSRDAGADVRDRLVWLQDHPRQAQRIRQQSAQFKRLCKSLSVVSKLAVDVHDAPGFLLACAYPDRIAQARERRGSVTSQDADFALSNGRMAVLRLPDRLDREPWLALAQVGGRAGDSRDQIGLAAPLNPNLFDSVLAELVQVAEQVDWDQSRERFRAERQRLVGKLVLDSQVMDEIAPEIKRSILCALLRKRGLEMLPWTDALRQWQARVMLLRQVEGEGSAWPDVSDAQLSRTLEDWLGPWLDSIKHLNDFGRVDLGSLLANLLPWPLSRDLDVLAPSGMTVPSGSRIAIDYTQSPPVLAVRLQEMFGCRETPKIATGRVPLLLHLLSPARRPLAVTQDLNSFWQNAYPEVKKEFKGRYPKHYWPDDPLQAEPTAKAKPRVHK